MSDNMQAELSRAAALVKALGKGFRQAGGDPELDLMRIVSQKGLATKLAEAAMDDLFVELYSFEHTVCWQVGLNHRLERPEAGWKDDTKCGSEQFRQQMLDFFENYGKEETRGRTFRYILFQAQRQIHAQEVCRRIGSGKEWPYAMEMIEVVENLPQSLTGKHIGIPWASYQGWTLAAKKMTKDCTCKLFMHPRMITYKAGCVFLRRIPVQESSTQHLS